MNKIQNKKGQAIEKVIFLSLPFFCSQTIFCYFQKIEPVVIYFPIYSINLHLRGDWLNSYRSFAVTSFITMSQNSNCIPRF